MVDFAALPKVVARAAKIKAEIQGLTEEYNELLDSLGTLEARNYPAGDYILAVTPNRRFDAATAKRVLPASKFESILTLKPDTTLARKVLDESEYALCQKDHGVRREIKKVEDME